MRNRLSLALAAGLLVLAGASWAQPAPALTAEQVLGKAVEAAGGKEAQAKLRTMVASGKLELMAMGITGTFQMNYKAPDKLLVVQSIQGLGEMKQGFDGKVGWAQDPFNGLRTLMGGELAAMRRGATINGEARWKDFFSRAEMLGPRKVNNVDTYAIRLTPVEGGEPVTQYYDAKSFLLVRTDMVVDSPQGKIPTESYVSDYRTIDGVKVPFVTRQKVANVAEITITMTDVKTNVELSDALFARPAK